MIGARARAWPIRDGSSQAQIIKAAASAVSGQQGNGQPPSSASSVKEENSAEEKRPPRRVVKDPYAADSLFELLSPGPEDEKKTHRVRPQRQTRDLSEIFVSQDGDSPENRPKKPASRPAAQKNFQPSSAFNNEEEEPTSISTPTKGRQSPVKGYSQRYSHFEIGADNSDREIKPKPARQSRFHQSQWNFEDFVTPEKPKGYINPQQVRHFGFSEDELPEEDENQKPRAARPRPDAETHFKLTDDENELEEQPTPNAQKTSNIFKKRAAGLYHDPLAPELNSPANYARENKHPFSTIANNAGRRKDLDPQWSMLDDDGPVKDSDNENKKPVGTSRLKAVQMMEPHWNSYDVSPDNKKTAPAPRRTVRSAMQKNWSLGDEDEF